MMVSHDEYWISNSIDKSTVKNRRKRRELRGVTPLTRYYVKMAVTPPVVVSMITVRV